MLLTYIFISLLFNIIFLIFINCKKLKLIKIVSLLISGLILFFSCFLLIKFDYNFYYFQEVITYNFGFNFLNLKISFGFDGVSLFFFVLTNLLMFLCFLFIWHEKILKEYTLNLLIIQLLLLLVFSVLDLFFFYIFFEAILIPMYFLIGFWGSRERRVRATYLLFFYTLFGSLCMLLGLIYIYIHTGTLSFEYLLTKVFSLQEQTWLWLAFFLSFASKIPLFPLHIWLPEAHVEAPTVGSVLLAGILLKLGVYGFFRFSLTFFSEASLFFSPTIYLFSIIGVIYASLNAVRQMDLKRIIAYSSIAHMNLVVLGIFSFNIIGLDGSILQSISHGFVSSAMFLLIGILYDRYHSRQLYYYGGLVHFMPLFATYFLIFTMANIALPGTSSFVGEFLLLLGIFKTNTLCSIMGATGIILCGTYSLWLYNRIIFGNIKSSYMILYKDLTIKDFILLFPLLTCVIIMGIYPTIFSNFIHLATLNISFLTIF